MIINLDPQKTTCLHQLFGDPEIFFTGARISTRVIVDQDDPCSRFQKGFTKNIPGMDDACIERPFWDSDFLNQSIGPVEKEDLEDLFP